MQRELHRVREDSTLARDVTSGAIIRTDLDAFQQRKAKKLESERLKRTDERITALEKKIEELESIILMLRGAA
uniref:Uncharacterized protein n=1 Tax=Rhizobium phage IG49 TaxID=3129228 RepID=A0AAU8HZ01_9CAUD